MAKAAELKISGIKCDNPKCDYKDDTVKFEDYKDWVNKPCPKCGANLLTEIDFLNTAIMMAAVEATNAKYPDGVPDEEVSYVSVKMNGTGKVEFDMQDEDKRIVVDPPKDLSSITKIRTNLNLPDME